MDNLQGLNLEDSRYLNVPIKSWAWAKNILISKGFKSIANEDGFYDSIEFDLPINGIIPTNDGYVAFTTDSVKSSITFVDNDGIPTPILSNDLTLLFRLDKPIEGLFKKNSKGEIIITWTDIYNEIRLLNITDVPNPFSLEKIALFPNVKRVGITTEILKNSGSLVTGAYQLIVAFESQDGVKTPWQIVHNPDFITEFDESDGYEKFRGSDVNKLTDKSINYTIFLNGNQDNFDKIHLAVIATVGKQKNAFKVAELATVSAYVGYNFTGEETNEELNLTEVLTDTAAYSKAKTITTLQDNLLIGNLQSGDIYDLQKYVNNWVVKWQAEVVDTNTLGHTAKNETGNKLYRTFMPREVYALYVTVRDTKGNLIHYWLPGRNPLAGDTGAHGLSNTGFGGAPLKYEVEDTCTTTASTAVSAEGLMGYWQNNNESYAADDCAEIWDNLGDTGNTIRDTTALVRHHRMPSMQYLRNQFGATIGVSQDVVLSIKLESVYIPPEIRDQIDSITLSYAKRDINNMTVYGQDMLHYGHQNSATVANKMSLGLNLEFDRTALVAGQYDIDYDVVRGHSPDLRRYKPEITPDYVASEYQIDLNYPTPQKFYDAAAWYENGWIDVHNRYNLSDTTVATTVPAAGARVRAINQWKYLPNHVFDSGLGQDNGMCESFIYVKLANATTLLSGAVQTLNAYTPTFNISDYRTARISYCALRTDVYQGYDAEREIVITDTWFDADTVSGGNPYFYGGDVFMTDNSIVTHVNWGLLWLYNSNPDFKLNDAINAPTGVGGGNIGNMTYLSFHIILNTVANWDLRYYDSAQPLTSYYPVSVYTRAKNRGDSDWILAYNDDYSTINDLNAAVVLSCDDIGNSKKYPYRIHRGLSEYNNIDEGISWAKFLANDFKEMQDRDKGEIWKLETFNTHLIIHQKYSLFVARLKDRIITDLTEIYLGQGDIFDREPDNVIPTKRGYAGNQSQWASIVCPLGYCFIDKEYGKVFIFDGKLNEISRKGVMNFLRTNLPVKEDGTDNPFMYEGLTMGYDVKWNRLIITRVLYIPVFVHTVVPDTIPDNVFSLNEYIVWKGAYYKIFNGSGAGGNNTTPDFIDTAFAIVHGQRVTNLNDVSLFVNNSFTLSYSPDLAEGRGGWVCFHDYYPGYMFEGVDRTYAVQNLEVGRVQRMNDSSRKGRYFIQHGGGAATTNDWFIDFIFNGNPDLEKYFLSVHWDTDVIDSLGKIQENKTIDSVMVYNYNQCTGEVTVDNNLIVTKNATNKKGQWAFGDIHDLVVDSTVAFIDDDKEVITANISSNKAWFNKDQIISKFVIVRFKGLNTDQEDIYINEAKVMARQETQSDN